MFKLLRSSLHKIKNALAKTRSKLGKGLKALFSKGLTEETIEELERILFEADLGSTCAISFSKRVQKFAKDHPSASWDQLIGVIKDEAKSILEKPPKVEPKVGSPHLILVVGINGSGKTTSIAKLSSLYKNDGKKVLIAAADTFRAAAVDQLTIWSEKVGVDIVRGKQGGDPSSVLFDAMSKAKTQNYDIVICDTAGRLDTRSDLMQELEKIKRVAAKLDVSAPHDTYIVIDATIGQNAIEQVKVFNQYTPLTGIILTKLDGSARGGVVLAIYEAMGIPIRFVGLGEGADDFEPFNTTSYVEALFSI